MDEAMNEGGFAAELRDSVRRVLLERCDRAAVRRVVDGGAAYDEALWSSAAELGWLGVAIPETYGGVGLGAEGLAVLAEECGRALAPIPISSSLILAANAILACGSEEQKRRLLPSLVAGSIGTVAIAEGAGPVNHDESMRVRYRTGLLSGEKLPVPDGAFADIAIVAACDDATGCAAWYVVRLDAGGVERTFIKTIDPGRPHARISFDRAEAEPLQVRGDDALRDVLDRAAIFTAFEQIGSARAALEMARSYAIERYAFGRPIGSFQAVKHRLVDAYVEIEIAAANATQALRVLDSGGNLLRAAATARLSATRAFRIAAEANMATHAGIGFTWEADCHLYMRRSRLLALSLGQARYWEDRLIDDLDRHGVADGGTQ